MKAITLTYHDAVEGNHFAGSGFLSEGAYVYKLDIRNMENHFRAIAAARRDKPANIADFVSNRNGNSLPFFLTFDDGGVSAATLIAPLLEKFGWIGHFFITASYVDADRFVSSQQLRDLQGRGHVIGTHSWSHPERMSKCSDKQLAYEWTRSIAKLSRIIEDEVTVASVPGGHYSRKVARVASACGIRALFTSEPVKEAYQVDRCLVLGRYGLQRQDPPALARALLSERTSLAQIRQYCSWNAKKLLKTLAGETYLELRGRILTRRERA